jgi:hypothetical protein
MGRQLRWSVVASVAFVLMSLPQGSGVASAEAPADQVSSASLPSDLMAAFVVAYDDYKTWAKSRGWEATPLDLSQRHHEILLLKDGTRAFITFSAASSESFGGGIRYTVDLKEYRIVKKEFTR